MALFGFLFESLVISASGVLSPGPMTAVTVGRGSIWPHAGALVAIGHGAVEFPLMAALFLGAGALIELHSVRLAVTLAGGLMLLVMGAGMLKGSARAGAAPVSAHSPFADGVLLSLLNPFFLIWWATVGLSLLMQAARFGALGFALFASLHWLCDFIWCYALSVASFKGGKLMGGKFNLAVRLVSGAALLFFGVSFIYSGIEKLM